MNTTTDWIEEVSSTLTGQESSLLYRAYATLTGNITASFDGNACGWFPLRGIVPSPGTYRGVWNWDSAFHARAAARWDPELGREQVRIFLDAQAESGALADVIFADGNAVYTFGKPPVFPWALEYIDTIEPDTEFLRYAYPKFVRYEEFWRRERGGDTEGLFHYDSSAPDPAKRFKDAKMESGWDNSVRFDSASYDLWPIDLNCYMVMLYRAMAFFARRLKKPGDQARWKKREAELSRRIEKQLYDENAGVYMDRHRNSGAFTGALSPASFMPLYTGIASKSRAEKMAALASDPKKLHPSMPTIAFDHACYQSNAYWRGPTWLNTAYFALKGLKEYGYEEPANKGKQVILDWCSQNKDALYEYYDSKTGKGLGASRFGWSAAFVIEFILNW
jgi:putative isomerase